MRTANPMTRAIPNRDHLGTPSRAPEYSDEELIRVLAESRFHLTDDDRAYAALEEAGIDWRRMPPLTGHEVRALRMAAMDAREAKANSDSIGSLVAAFVATIIFGAAVLLALPAHASDAPFIATEKAVTAVFVSGFACGVFVTLVLRELFPRRSRVRPDEQEEEG